MTNILSFALGLGFAMIVHELGHIFAARKCGVAASELGLGVGRRLFAFSIRNLTVSLRAIPIASFVRLDGNALNRCTVTQRSFVHLGGIIFNLLAATIAQGTLLGRINLLLALANLVPIYKHDGWKVGVVLMRALLGRTSPPVEWAFTFSGGFASLVIITSLIHLFR
jgi:membrane-associated protease RseP (regulator of RpoE activity)